jgi:hypothetical protein
MRQNSGMSVLICQGEAALKYYNIKLLLVGTTLPCFSKFLKAWSQVIRVIVSWAFLASSTNSWIRISEIERSSDLSFSCCQMILCMLKCNTPPFAEFLFTAPYSVSFLSHSMKWSLSSRQTLLICWVRPLSPNIKSIKHKTFHTQKAIIVPFLELW